MTKHEEIRQMLAVYDDLVPSERTQVDAHIDGCMECATRLRAYQTMDRTLQQLPRLQPEPVFRQDFYTKLELTMNNHTRNKQIRRIPAFALQLLVVGAIILLGISFWASLRSQEHVSISAPPAATNQLVPSPASELSTQSNEQTSPNLHLKDVSFDPISYAPGDSLTVSIEWHEIQPTGAEIVSLMLMDFATGLPVAQLDEPLVLTDPVQTKTVHTLMLPPTLENGRYLLQLSVYDQTSGMRLALPAETVNVPQMVIVGETVAEQLPTPILETAVIQLESWSPDSQYLILREYSETEIPNKDPGVQHVYDLTTGTFCPHPIDVRPDDIHNWLAWIDDHTFAYITSNDQIAVRDICYQYMGNIDLTLEPVHAILEQSHDLGAMLLHVGNRYELYLEMPNRIRLELPDNLVVLNASFSPDDQLLALIDTAGTLWLVDTNNGNVILSTALQMEGQSPNPIWLSNDELLVHTTATTPTENAMPTPFILNLDGDITQLTTLFTTTIDETTQRILAAPDVERGSYTILLYTDPQLGEPAPVRAYHSDTGTVETLPYTDIWADGITENGRYLLVSEESEFGSNSSIVQGITEDEDAPFAGDEIANGTDVTERNFRVRQVTAVGEDFEGFMVIGPNSGTPTTPNKVLMGLAETGILIDTTTYPTIMQAEHWDDTLGHSTIKDILWSPDAKHVGVVRETEKNTDELFILATNQFSPSSEEETAGVLIPATVVDTQLEGLPLYTTPGGELIDTLSEGTTVSMFLDVPTQEQDNLTWRKVRTVDGVEGWVVERFLAPILPGG